MIRLRNGTLLLSGPDSTLLRTGMYARRVSSSLMIRSLMHACGRHG
jgi:hypothetical protein|eukprot:COSAG01_NODE_1712_length_9409_cov_4.588077_10_plen_46_part_00